ncbi:MAG: 4Fe-4S dicluster domain-containing protein [Nitrospinae bacterium]|nr:4Fe-4S dicluster domain-containing protein [Nitrospinota bacterium]
MSVDRRDFLKIGAVMAAGTVVSSGAPLLTAAMAEGENSGASARNQWGMVIDINKCSPDCTACYDACRKENNVPHFPEPELDIHWIRKITFKQKGVPGAEERAMPAMCYHCQHAPCEHVCPVAATFTRADGIVLVDKHRCIGCRYCMIACPYKARSFVSRHVEHDPAENPDAPIRMHGVVEKCDLCVHRIDKGEKPACVEACAKAGGGGMLFGDLNDPDSEVSKIVRTGKATRIRADLGTNPRVFYVGI